ncbi:hypothetical protein FNAPI_5306 [Fusarium napiforme]|uniref:Uncharacterized protein n=1 Tax=Fusarium napiforme TaxID=42672 RepID=A0A8H5JLV8_9HYPO|nr:hypothetical protein FNAPI_5306 [Fusarium napiforme]
MSQDLQPSTAVGFQQQGTVDWTRVLSGSVTFSVDVLSRLSTAGIEAFTVYAARAIFSKAKLGPNGELRLHRALAKLSAFPSFGKVLWFGFGVKHIIWSMQESTEDLNCLGICACLAEGFSTIVAAKVMRELFLLYNPPVELTPALRQWISLVECSGGLLASSEFGLVLHGLTKICLKDGVCNLQGSGSPKDIALVLKEVFEVSAGRLDRLFLSGGTDCAWIAAVAHWLLDLRVDVQEADGTIIYRPDGTRSESSPDAQVIITYHQGRSSELIQVDSRHYIIRSGEMLFEHAQYQDIMSYGRVSWESCLVDTFGSPMKILLKDQARITGACLGSAARIFLAIMRDGEGHEEFSLTDNPRDLYPPIVESSFGRGFYLSARRLLPELGQNTVLDQAMEAAMNKGYVDATQQFSQAFTSLRQLCSCLKCRPNGADEGKEITFCLLSLILTICDLIRVMPTICMQKDLEVQPTRAGLERLYLNNNGMSLESDPVRCGLMGSKQGSSSLTMAQTLFAGRQNERDMSSGFPVASSHSGLCFCLNTLMETTSDPQAACIVVVVPGRIQWNNSMYETVSDQSLHGVDAVEQTGYDAISMTTVLKYDDLNYSSSPGLSAQLVITEDIRAPTSLFAAYRLSTPAYPGRSFSVGAAYVWRQLNRAFTAATCEGKMCESPNGFQSTLVRGDGLLAMIDEPTLLPPIIRVLPPKDLSVWVVLSQCWLPKFSDYTKGRTVVLRHRLQGGQCVRCCIVLTEKAAQHGMCGVSILTSL